MSPLAFTDQQIQIVLAMAKPIALPDRRHFLQAVAEALAGLPELGDGAIARACCAAQRQYWRAPLAAD